MAVTDPFSVLGWEAFRQEAFRAGLKPLLGMEIHLRGLGTLVIFPAGNGAYGELADAFNRRRCGNLEDMVVLFSPAVGSDPVSAFSLLKGRVAPGSLYLGLEWHTPRVAVTSAREAGIPMAWANPLRWVESPERYAAVGSVFHHRPFTEVLGRMDRVQGPLSAAAVLRRWGEPGREAMRNTFAVAERVNFSFSDFLPASHSGGRQLERVVHEQMRRRALSAEETGRALRELRVIVEMGVASHFLVAARIAAYCRRGGIYCNLRGSGVSSFLLYLLGVSRIHPLRHGLIFERFVNRLREDSPDIDVDLDSSRRAEVLKWVLETYSPRVAFVSTHKFFRARSALYEMARSRGLAPDEAHSLSREIPVFHEPRELVKRGQGPWKELYRRASLLQGVYRETSLHVGGVVITGAGEIRRLFPVSLSPSGFPQLVWDKRTVARLKVFKLDLLGVRGFDVIAPVALGEPVDMSDSSTWEVIRSARTIGCFQLESPLARKNLAAAAPANLSELGISIAIIRPGPARSGMKAAYINRRPPAHPVLGRLFPHTRGTLIFEEQISVLLHTLTGWSLEESERVRRELRKGDGEGYREKFFQAGGRGGFPRVELETLWKMAVDFSAYAFNQGHSTSYAYSAFLSAWLKTHRPATFFRRLLNAGGGYYPLSVYVEETRRWGIDLLPPDVNRSGPGFSEEGGAIRAGLLQVKGVGAVLARRVMAARRKPFSSVEDFVSRCGSGERELSALMAVGAFVSLGGATGCPPQRQNELWERFLGFMPGPGHGSEPIDKSGFIGNNEVTVGAEN